MQRRILLPVVCTLALASLYNLRFDIIAARAGKTAATATATIHEEGQVQGSKMNLCRAIAEAEAASENNDTSASADLLMLSEFPAAAVGASATIPMPPPVNRSSVVNSNDRRCSSTLDSPRKVVDIFLFGGGEVDTLEIRLYELYDVVDEVVAFTSDDNHKGELTTNILPPLLKTPRFAAFRQKFRILNADQRNLTKQGVEQVNWSFETQKELWLAKKAREMWDQDTVVVYSHVDKIPHREQVWKLKWCSAIELPGNYAIWFPFGRIDRAYRSDFPSAQRPFTLGDPGAFWANNVEGWPRGKYRTPMCWAGASAPPTTASRPRSS